MIFFNFTWAFKRGPTFRYTDILSKYPAINPDKNKHTPAIAACGIASEVNGSKLCNKAVALVWLSKGSSVAKCQK